MATVYAARVKETTTKTGNEAAYPLGGAVTGYRTFASAIGTGNSCWYCCTDGTDWEIGHGTYADGVLTRTDTIDGSGSGGPGVNWSAGSKEIFCIFPHRMLSIFSADNGLYLGNSSDELDTVGSKSVSVGISNYIPAAESYAVGFSNQLSSKAFALGRSNYANNSPLTTYSYAIGYKTKNNYSGDTLLISTSGPQNIEGDSQTQIITAYVTTTNATQSSVGHSLSPASTNTAVTVVYDITVVARQTAGSSGTVGDSKSWKLQAMCRFTDGTATQIGTTVSTTIAASTGASAWACSLDFSNANPIRVTGEADKTIRWVALINATEVV